MALDCQVLSSEKLITYQVRAGKHLSSIAEDARPDAHPITTQALRASAFLTDWSLATGGQSRQWLYDIDNLSFVGHGT